MKIYNVSEEEIIQALEITNRHFKNNIDFNDFSKRGSKKKPYYNVTLRNLNCKEIGAGRSPYMTNKDGTQRKIKSACWDAHGHFFDILCTLNPNVIIYSLSGTIKIYVKDGRITGNWQNWERGYAYTGTYNASELCECNVRPTIPDNLEPSVKKSGQIIWLEA